MIRNRSFHATLIAGAALCTPAFAQDAIDPYELSPEQLFDATVLSVSRTLESVREAPAAVFVITAQDIERSGATSIAEALRLAPGVQVARINSSGWAVSVRGFNSPLANKLLVLVDGRETYDPLFSGVYWDVQDTPLEDIERIEVVRGPGASLWGANAVNGVINIITRRASDTQGALVSVIAGEGERAGLTLRYGGAIGENTHWRIYGRAFDREGQETLSGADDASDWQALRGGFRIDSEIDARNSLTLQGDIYRSETGQFRQVFSFAAPYAALVEENITAEGGNLLGRWTRELDGGGRLTTQAYVDVTRREQATLEDRRTTFDLDVQYDFPELGAHRLMTGIRYRRSSDDVTETEMIRSLSDNHTSELVSAFVQDQLTLGGGWGVTIGSKFDQNDYTGFEVQPSARIQWVGETQTVWGSVSRAIRSPSELDREFDILLAAGPPFPLSTLPLTIELLPSPGFDSEEVVAVELGYRQQVTPALAVDVALFRNDYEGLATLTALGAQFDPDPARIILIPIVTTNATDAITQGGEVVMDWHPSDELNISFAYSFLDMDIEAPVGAINGESAEGQSPQHQANLRVHWDASARLMWDAALYYVDELPGFQIDAYLRTDLRVGYKLTDQLYLEFVGQNLLDDAHREFTASGDANAAMIGRSVFGRLTWRH